MFFSDFKQDNRQVLGEIEEVLNSINPDQAQKFINLFDKNNARKIVIAGAGRMGYAAKGFAMRLGHMGFTAWMVGDSTVPHIGVGDLLIVASGSGNTQTIYDIAVKAHQNGANIALVTNNPDSRIGSLSTTIVKIENKNNKLTKTRTSKQPMSTLNEQCLSLFFDTCVLGIMRKNEETHESMWARHSNLE